MDTLPVIQTPGLEINSVGNSPLTHPDLPSSSLIDQPIQPELSKTQIRLLTYIYKELPFLTATIKEASKNSVFSTEKQISKVVALKAKTTRFMLRLTDNQLAVLIPLYEHYISILNEILSSIKAKDMTRNENSSTQNSDTRSKTNSFFRSVFYSLKQNVNKIPPFFIIVSSVITVIFLNSKGMIQFKVDESYKTDLVVQESKTKKAKASSN